MSRDTRKTPPRVFDLDQEELPSVAEAPVIDDQLPEATALTRHVAARARRSVGLWGWAFGTLVALIGFVISWKTYDFMAAALDRSPILGLFFATIVALFCALLLIVVGKELSGFFRLKRLDQFQDRFASAKADRDLELARKSAADLLRFYRGHSLVGQAASDFAPRVQEVLDAEDIIGGVEAALMPDLDAAALEHVQSASRQVATVTALVPLAFADVLSALTLNLRMIRRIAEVYGGRSGSLGSWRLTRTVFMHLVATGAVAVTDDLLGSVAGGGLVSKVSRRFGEGIVNGALTARIGVAAMEVCRPVAFDRVPRPGVGAITSRALSGLFGRA